MKGEEEDKKRGKEEGGRVEREGSRCYSKYKAVTVGAQCVPYLLSRLNRCGGRR